MHLKRQLKSFALLFIKAEELVASSLSLLVDSKAGMGKKSKTKFQQVFH